MLCKQELSDCQWGCTEVLTDGELWHALCGANKSSAAQAEKGNRWLYQLDKPYFEHSLDRLLTACENNGFKLFSVTGKSIKDHVRQVYDEDVDGKWKPEIGERIVKIYNQELKSLNRSPETLRTNGLQYHQITRK